MVRRLNVGFITTVNTNIGDEFIRRGIENLIKSILEEYNYTINSIVVHKHNPYSIIRKYSILGLLYRLPNFPQKNSLVKYLESKFAGRQSVFSKVDIIIQSGAPVIWPNASENCEWKWLIWDCVLSQLSDKITILNLAAGACFPFIGSNEFSNSSDKEYVFKMGKLAKLTIVRDKLAEKLFKSVDIDVYRTTCAAFFVNKSLEKHPRGNKFFINYMEGGGHFEYNQKIDIELWRETFKSIINEFKDKIKIEFICHSSKEVDLAKSLDSSLKINFPKTVDDYLKVISEGFIAVNNRLHASVAMASFLVPSISIGTDTRLYMIEEIGLKYYFIKEVNKEQLIRDVYDLINKQETYSNSIFENKVKNYARMRELVYDYFKNYDKG